MRAAPQRTWVLITVFLLLGAAAVVRCALWFHNRAPPTALNPALTETARQVAKIEATEESAARQFFGKELLAERCALAFEELWDNLNRSSNKLAVLADFPCPEIVGPKLAQSESLPHGIQIFKQEGPGLTWTPAAWKSFLSDAATAGWQLAQTELRHVEFDTDAHGRPERSRFYCCAHLLNPERADRAIVEGDLEVRWEPELREGQAARVHRIEARQWTVRERRGSPGFREWFSKQVSPMAGSYFIDPLILHDLDHDGLSEIILAARNLVFHRLADGTFEERPLCRYSPGLIFTALIADFDGDGAADFLCAKFDGLWLFKGSAQGTFDEPGRQVWSANPHLKYGQALTCGDIDGDGDLDVWLGQYKPPYDRGQMPTPFYDANDGYPSYLLLNDGKGNLTDATASAGLAPKRWRRAYSGSFVDLNHDGHLDLVVANDFAGVDLFANDGHGHFSDVTGDWIPDRHAFGMSQVRADFDGDGELDLLVTGMNVPVMDRLLHMRSSRPGFESWMSMAKEMIHGNRLYRGTSAGRFQTTPLNDSIARTGWSWGASPLDVDNDGFPDLYVANGHETKQFVRDYETEFWLHDIYVGTSMDSLPAFAYFQAKFARTRGRGMSYGGYERNRLFLNQRGKEFVEVGYLMGVGLQQDCRNVVADDLDGDGRVDLLVTTFEAWPQVQQTLRVFRNELETTNNWIGFRFMDAPGQSPVGLRVTLEYSGRRAVAQIVAGDSYRSQQANTVHFGLGAARRVDRAEFHWLSGRKTLLRNPELNRYHFVSPGEVE